MKQLGAPIWQSPLLQQRNLRSKDLIRKGRIHLFSSGHYQRKYSISSRTKGSKRNDVLLNYLDDCLEHYPYVYSIPVTYKHGYYFIKWTYTNIVFARCKLQQFHLHFMHPTTYKLFHILKQARPESTNHEVRHALQEISDACEQ